MSLLATLGSVGSNLLGYGGQAAAGFGTSFANGMIGNYFNRKQAQLNYEYQERVARNSPKWHVDGLRNAGLNPILAANGGSFSGGSWTPATASVQGATAPDLKLDPISRKQVELLNAQIKGQKIDNKKTSADIPKIEMEAKRDELKAKAEYELLKPELIGGPYAENEPKQVYVQKPSTYFQRLQKAIKDDYDLRSERYIRETSDAVMKYGVDVLKLLPIGKKAEILKTIMRGGKSGKTSKTSPKNAPKTSEEPVFQYD